MRKGLTHAAGYALVIALGKGVSLFMLPVITHALPVAEYGRLELMVAIADIGSVLCGFALVDALFRFAGNAENDQDKKDITATLFGICLSFAAISLLFTQLCASYLLQLLPDSIIELELRLLLFTITLTALIQMPLAWLRMQDRVAAYCLLFGGKTVLQSGLVYVALMQGYGVMGILTAGLVADVALCMLLGIVQYRDTGIRLPRKQVASILPYNAPLVVGGLSCCLLGTFDRFFLAPVIGGDALAHYALAGKFALIVALFAQPFDMWWFPKRFSILNEEDGALKSARSVMLGVCYITLASVAVAFLAPWMIEALTPPAYHAATVWVPWLVGIAGLHAITNWMNVGAYAGKTGMLPTAINITASLAAFAGYVLLIGPYGVAGAIGATYLAFILRFLLFYRLSQRRVFIPYLQGFRQLCVLARNMLQQQRCHAS